MSHRFGVLCGLTIAGLLAAPTGALTAQDDVRVTLLPRGPAAPDATRPPWTGERIPLDVRIAVANGIFRGRPALDLPEVAGTTLYRLDAPPVLGSETERGITWTTQTIELAAWVQQAGTVTIPAIGVRFATAASTLGAATPQAVRTEPLQLTIRRPPGTEQFGSPLLVSADVSIDLHWEPPTDPLQPGDARRWSASLRAADVPAILLPRLGPALPIPRPSGLAIHPAAPALTTRAPRGALKGTRDDAFTVVCEGGGRFSLPAWSIRWWDPRANRIREQRFEAIELRAIAVDHHADTAAGGRTAPPPRAGPLVLGILALLALVAWWAWARFGRRMHLLLERTADHEAGRFRAVTRACRRGDPRAIDRALQRWRAHPAAPPEVRAAAQHRPAALEHALRSLGRAVGAGPAGRFDGSELLAALHRSRQVHHRRARLRRLPQLNPRPDSPACR